MAKLIDKIYACVNSGARNVKYGVYLSGDASICVGLTYNRLIRQSFIDGETEFNDVVSVNVFSDEYKSGAECAESVANEIAVAGYTFVKGMESRYDREINKYVIDFAISEN